MAMICMGQTKSGLRSDVVNAPSAPDWRRRTTGRTDACPVPAEWDSAGSRGCACAFVHIRSRPSAAPSPWPPAMPAWAYSRIISDAAGCGLVVELVGPLIYSRGPRSPHRQEYRSTHAVAAHGAWRTRRGGAAKGASWGCAPAGFRDRAAVPAAASGWRQRCQGSARACHATGSAVPAPARTHGRGRRAGAAPMRRLGPGGDCRPRGQTRRVYMMPFLTS